MSERLIYGLLLCFLPSNGLVLPKAPSSHLSTDPARLTFGSFSDDRISNIQLDRRQILNTLGLFSSLALLPSSAFADDLPPSIVSPAETLLRLRKVPTFCIVDGEGTPFMTYDSQSAGANGYFFLEYGNAEAVLEDAKKAYKEALEAGEKVVDSWGASRIVTMPLDFAMRMTVKQTKNKAQNADFREFRTIIQVLPTAADLDAALLLDNGARFRQRGRVPLFYAPGLDLTAGDGSKVTPVFFNTRQLKAAWAKLGLSGSPSIQVRELNETFRAMVKPGGTDESVRNLVFIPSDVASTKSLELRKKQGDGQVYKSGEIILTK